MTDPLMTLAPKPPLLRLPALVRLLRPHHWIKSAFVAAPLFFTPSVVSQETLVAVSLGVLLWSLVASSLYIFNDWKDRAADREHPIKQFRPLASGAVKPSVAFVVMLLLALIGLGGSFFLAPAFAPFLWAYAGLNIAYSLRLKHIAIIDVMCIALGFVLRILAGAALIAVTPSAWIIILTGLLALFLGLAKRRDDIIRHLGTDHRASLEGYSRRFIDATLSITLGAALVSYLVFTTDRDVMARLGSQHLFYTAPFVIYAMLRYLQIAMVEERSGSPVLILLTDKPMLAAVMGWVLAFAGIIYL